MHTRFRNAVRQAVPLQAAVFVVGALAIGVGFAFSYVDAFHDPTPHRVRVDVVATAPLAQRLADSLSAARGHVLRAHVADSEGAAVEKLREGSIHGAVVVNPDGTTDRVLYASGDGATVAEAVKQIAATAERSQHRTASFSDVVPLQSGDFRGLSGFYLTVGWLVAGYLMAAFLGVATEIRPGTVENVSLRLLVAVAYAVIAGLCGALVVDPLLGAMTGHFLALWGTGALIVAAAATTTLALQAFLGFVGVGLAIILFVVLGNPSAGGAYQLELLPAFWRDIGPLLPNGAGTESLRHILYFGSHNMTGHIAVLASYIVVGATLAVAGAYRNERRAAAETAPVPSTAGALTSGHTSAVPVDP